MRPRAIVLLITVFGLAGASAALLLGDIPSQALDDERAEAVQRLVGGLGFGPAMDLSRCPFSFDPRLGCACLQDLGPLPAGGWFCPEHACSIFFYPPLDGPAHPQKPKPDHQRPGNVEIP